MKKLIILISLFSIFLFPQNTIKDFDSYSFPTKYEFDVYRQTWLLLRNLPFEGDWEQGERLVMQKVAKSFGTTAEHVNKISLKISWYDMFNKDLKAKSTETMPWSDFKQLMKEMGKPWPSDPQNPYRKLSK